MSLSVDDLTHIIRASRETLGLDQFGRKKCKHMREDGICLKGASSSGRCMQYCSYYETQSNAEVTQMKTIEQRKEEIMRNGTLSDIQKLQNVFDISKDQLKRNDPQLYYAILGVLDHAKCGARQMTFRHNECGFLLREDFNTIVGACKIIGDAIWDSPGSGMTENGKDYVPADIMYSPEEIKEAIKIVKAYFGG